MDDWFFLHLGLTAAPPERKRFALAQTNSIPGLNCKTNKENADWLALGLVKEGAGHGPNIYKDTKP
jgi:hypothetical protein